MRLISTAEAKNVPEKLAHDAEFTAPKTFYVEKAKGNTIPKHFTAEENKDRVSATINGTKTTLYRSIERSEYVAFELPKEGGKDGETQAYYVRDHSFLDNTSYVTYNKPTREAAPKKEKKEKAEDLVPLAKKNYEVTDVKAGTSVQMTGKQFIEKFGLEKATAILNGRRSKTFTADEYAGEVDPAANPEGDTGAA